MGSGGGGGKGQGERRARVACLARFTVPALSSGDGWLLVGLFWSSDPPDSPRFSLLLWQGDGVKTGKGRGASTDRCAPYVFPRHT